mmetsp:Transcript_947/g.2314  ORF Transcript_947/g.2314 Transcript_947/m.2314 type:complete len:297 (-) Transcript_947:105-995(-)
MEMKDAASLCKVATSKSLILIDELGRATSNEDGVAIAWSVSEHMLTLGAMTFFVSHYPQLSRLADVYPRVQNQHMGAAISKDSLGDVRYSHKILPGTCGVTSDYGVEMALSCGWPENVVRKAHQLVVGLQEKISDGGLPLVKMPTKDPFRETAETDFGRIRVGLLRLKSSISNEEADGVCETLQELRKSVNTEFSSLKTFILERMAAGAAPKAMRGQYSSQEGRAGTSSERTRQGSCGNGRTREQEVSVVASSSCSSSFTSTSDENTSTSESSEDSDSALSDSDSAPGSDRHLPSS